MQKSKLKFKIQNYSSGFTLIELLVVILVIFSVGVLISSILFSALRGANKTNTIDLVRRNGNSAITQMSRMIRYSQSFDGVAEALPDGSPGPYTTSCVPIAALPPVISAPYPRLGLFLDIANLIQGFGKAGKKEISSLFSKLASIPQNFISKRTPHKEVASATAIINLGWDGATNSNAGNRNRIRVSRILVPVNGTEDGYIAQAPGVGGKMYISNDGTNLAGNVYMVVYSDVSSSPGNLIAVSNVFPIPSSFTGAWVDFTFPTSFNIDHITNPYIWLGMYADDPTNDTLSGGNGPYQYWHTAVQPDYTADLFVNKDWVAAPVPTGFGSYPSQTNNHSLAAYLIVNPPVTPTPTPSPTPTPTALRGWWKLDETSGTTAVDSSGNGNNGILSGAAFSTNGKYNGGAIFDNVPIANADYINLPMPNAPPNFSGTFTIELWAKWTGLAGIQALAGKVQDSGNIAFVLFKNSDNKIYLNTKTPSGQSGSSANPTVVDTVNWWHIAAVMDGSSNVALYVDKVSPVANPTTTLAMGNRNNLGSLRVGATPDGFWGVINGIVDNVKIYNTARTQQDITNDMGPPPTPTPTPTLPPPPTPTLPPPPTPTPSPVQYHYAQVTGFDGGKTVFHCDTSGIASNSASLIDTSSVDVESCSFTCSQDNISSPPNIGINFSLTQKGNSGGFFENKDKASFQTSVSVRNY